MSKGDLFFIRKDFNQCEYEDAAGEKQRALVVVNPLTEQNDIIKIPIDFYFSKANGVPTTLSAPASQDTRTLEVVDPSSFSIGDRALLTTPFGVYSGDVKAVVGSAITVAPLLNTDYLAGASVQSRTIDLNVDGSVTPQKFEAFLPPGLIANNLNIIRMIGECLTDSSVDLSKFGDIVGGLEYGLLLRGVPDPALGIPPTNNWNVRTNGELAGLAYDWNAYAASNPNQGQDGFLWRYTWGGEDKHGVAPAVSGIDKIELIIQDDLTSLDRFRMLYAGNVELVTI